MGQTIQLTGMILSAFPIGEYDKRIILLTKERGKITAFARGARRQNSELLAAANPFSFGEFEAFEGKASYTVVKANITNTFFDLTKDVEAVYYGFYFLEMAAYFTQENNDEIHMLKLLYQTLRALKNDRLDHRLIRCVYELKTMVINGEYPNVFTCLNCRKEDGLKYFLTKRAGILCDDCQSGEKTIPIDNSVLYTLQYIISSSIEKLYTFTVSENVLVTLERIMKEYLDIFVGKDFKSLHILDENNGFTILRLK